MFLLATVPAESFAKKASNGSVGAVLAVPAPVPVAGTPTCADLNASSDPAFGHIIENWGLRINRSGATPYDLVFPFVNGPDTELQGGAGPTPASVVRVAAGGSTMSWVSNTELTAVIVQGPAGANVYPYNPPSRGGFPGGNGSGLVTPGACANIVSITFCYQALQPTAAPASISGRVVTSNGSGISGARLTITNAQTGTTWGGFTNNFGYFRVEGMPVGSLYTVTVSHRQYSFANDTQTISLSDDVTGVEFVANP